MAEDALRKELELRAQWDDQTTAGKQRRRELENRIADYNASIGYYREPKPYIIPGDYTDEGWYRPDTGKQYVTMGTRSAASTADTVAHEGLHKLRRQAGVVESKAPAIFGNSEVERDALGHPDFHKLMQLQALLSGQNTFPLPGNYNANAEETYATYAGIEGQLPRGTAITSRPEFAQLNHDQRLKNLLFSETSVPYGGVWEGQSQPGVMDKFRDLQRSVKPYQDKAMELLGQLIGTR